MEELDEIWEALVINCVATPEELNLITSIMGYNKDTFNAVVYTRTGYQDYEQWVNYVMKEK